MTSCIDYCELIEDIDRGVEFCMKCGVETNRILFGGLGEGCSHNVFRPKTKTHEQKQIERLEKQIERLKKEVERLKKDVDRYVQRDVREFQRVRNKQLRQETKIWNDEIRDEERRQRRYR